MIEMNFIEVENRNVEQYRRIMEGLIRRKLTNTEVIHHIDGNPLNNGPNNLMLFKNMKEHTQYHYYKLMEQQIINEEFKYPNQKMLDYYYENRQKILQKDLLKRISEMNGEKICPICGRIGFINNKSLSNHIRWHKGYHRKLGGD
jgi:hypothetical protein